MNKAEIEFYHQSRYDSAMTIRTIYAITLLPVMLLAQERGQRETVKAPTDVKPGSITYEEIDYPYPVHLFPLTLYGQDVKMAYMDVPPEGTPNGHTVVLFHGMNFGGFYFEGPINVLRKEGYRVIVPDQIGFGRSSKPIIPYNFHDMAANTRKLLDSLGVNKAIVIGHSMGGMLAARFSATYTDLTERVVIYNPIGLTDVRWQRPWTSTEDVYKRTMAESQDQLYAGFSANIHRYFPNAWKPEYEKYVRILYAPTLSSDWPRLAMVRAIYTAITYLDPVVYDWAHIKCKALVIGGELDGPDFPAQAKHIADSIPSGNATLVLLPGLGHVPHLQAPDVFYKELLKFLKS